MENLTFEAVCTLVGRLYIESQHELKSLREAAAHANDRAISLEKERDAAILAMTAKRE